LVDTHHVVIGLLMATFADSSYGDALSVYVWFSRDCVWKVRLVIEWLSGMLLLQRCTVQHSEGILMLSVSRWKKM